jgi:hypothetical protein
MTPSLSNGLRADLNRFARADETLAAEKRVNPTWHGTIERAAVAQLTVDAIAGMTDGELARVVRMVVPCPNLTGHVGCYDRGTLVRLVYLARQVCRRQGYCAGSLETKAN